MFSHAGWSTNRRTDGTVDADGGADGPVAVVAGGDGLSIHLLPPGDRFADRVDWAAGNIFGPKSCHPFVSGSSGEGRFKFGVEFDFALDFKMG